MKITMPSGSWTFTPGVPGTGQIDFSYPGFVQENLYAVINTSASGNPIIFSTSGGASLGGTFVSGTILRPNFDTSSMGAGDALQVIYDDASFIQDVTGSITVGSAPPSSMSFGLMTGPSQGAPGNTYFDGAAYVEAPPYKSFTTQVVASASATGFLFFEGSNNAVNWNTIYVYQVNDPQAILTSAFSISGGTTNTYTGAINFRFIRARSATGFGAGTIQLFTTFSQTTVDPAIPNRQLVDAGGRPLAYGQGSSNTSTLRVIPADDAQILQREVHISSASQTALNINMMTGTTASYDCTGYRSIGIQIRGGAGISAGQVIWEGSNDDVNWATQIMIPPTNSTPSPITSALSITASATFQYYASLSMRYYRLRISTGFTGGSITAQFRLSPNHVAGMATPVIGTVTAVVSSATLNAGTVTAATLSSAVTADISSGAITTTTTSSAVTYSSIASVSLSQIITASSGTNQTLDTVVQCSMDNGTNWFDVYHFPRVTGTGQWYSPPMKLRGVFLRYVRTIGGSTPSFTMAINRNAYQIDAPIIGVFFDRTIAPNTLNSVTPSYFVEGCDEFSMIVNMGAITTTAPIFQLEGSEDNSNWYSLGTALTSVASSTVVMNTGTTTPSKFIRARVSTGGSGATLGYVCLKSKNT